MSVDLTPDDIIRLLDLQPLAGEGGFFRQTYAQPSSSESGDAPAATAILYLVTPESFSALHRLTHDELFHFYLGDPCNMVIVSPDGVLSCVRLGQDLVAGMRVQQLVPAGCWQGTRLCDGGRFALLGTTMTPGYDSAEFELAGPDDLDGLLDNVRADVSSYLAPDKRS